MNHMIDTINQRYSVRNYTDKPVEKEKMQAIHQFLDENKEGPMGSKVRFEIIDASAYPKEERRALGTYGMLSGDRIYIAGAVLSGKYAMEDYGYCMEKNILMLTEMGLGTCWLGGTFNRSIFSQKLRLQEKELIPGVTPLGYTGEKKTLKENLIRSVVGAKKRRNADEMFFEGKAGVPLKADSDNAYTRVLEAVRIGPSASNKQPWRIIKDAQGSYHLYLDEDEKYNHRLGDIRIQNVDMGIAMCHFELAAKELGIAGKWIIAGSLPEAGQLKYIVSWQAT